MIKLNASYSKKLPAEVDFSSKSFMACIEVELPAGASPQELQTKIHETFELVKQSVDSEIAEKAVTENKPEAVKLSQGQLKYIQDLGKARNRRPMDLNEEVSQLYGVESIFDLSMQDASRYLDHLMNAKAA